MTGVEPTLEPFGLIAASIQKNDENWRCQFLYGRRILTSPSDS